MDGWSEFRQALAAQPLTAGDAIFLMVGDGLHRAPHAANLYRDGYAPVIAIVGNDDRRGYGSFPAREITAELENLGVPSSAIHARPLAPHTRAEAESFLSMACEFGWKTALMVTSPHHQYRAFLTFLKVIEDTGSDLLLVNAPAPLSWTEDTPWGRRADLLTGEMQRIVDYSAKGDVAVCSEGLKYLAAGNRVRASALGRA